MEVILYTGFAPITHCISFWPEPIKNGKNSAISGHIINVKEETVIGDAKLISATCIRTKNFKETKKLPPYKVQLYVSCSFLFMVYFSSITCIN